MASSRPTADDKVRELFPPNTPMLRDSRSGPLDAIDALILCGGVGSRLRPVVSDRPKSLAPIGGRPFLDILVEDLLQYGIRRIIFGVGHMKEQIIDRYQDRDDAEYLFSQENVPLGTGGAVQIALPVIHSDPFLVMNGDSVCQVDFDKFRSFHMARASNASFVLTKADERYDGGVVCIGETQRIHSFLEKTRIKDQRRCFISAGIYLLQRQIFERQYIEPPFSLEYDVFPEMISTKLCFGFVVESELVDIGTPERYSRAIRDYRE